MRVAPFCIKKRSKFNAKKTEVDRILFDSKKEAKRYVELKSLKKAGEVIVFFRQLPLRLPEGTSYKLDFLVFWRDGNVTFEDVKGMKTDVYKLKKKRVEHYFYPVEITEL